MEELSRQLGGSSRPVAAGNDLLYLPSSSAPTSSSDASSFYGRAGDHHHNNHVDSSNYFPDAAYLLRPQPPMSQGEITAVAEDTGVKAKIMSHPQCSTLIAAYIDCQKVHQPHPSPIHMIN